MNNQHINSFQKSSYYEKLSEEFPLRTNENMNHRFGTNRNQAEGHIHPNQDRFEANQEQIQSAWIRRSNSDSNLENRGASFQQEDFSSHQQRLPAHHQSGRYQEEDRKSKLKRAYESLDQIDRHISELRVSPPKDQQQHHDQTNQHSPPPFSHKQQPSHPQMRERVTYQIHPEQQHFQLHQPEPIHHYHTMQPAQPPLSFAQPPPNRMMQAYPPLQHIPVKVSRSTSDGLPQYQPASQQTTYTHHIQIAPTLSFPSSQFNAQHLNHPYYDTATHKKSPPLRASPPASLVYMVHFKRRISEYLSIPSKAHHVFSVSDFVVVSSEPFGEDLGVVVEVLTADEYETQRRAAQTGPMDRRQAKMASKGNPGVAANEITGRILRLATVSERQRLPFKHADEEAAVAYCQHLVRDVIRIPQMAVFDAEFTIDRRKLTFYYHSEVHVDFRELVKDMYTKYKTRIWMKKMSQEPVFRPQEFALVQLITGAQLTLPMQAQAQNQQNSGAQRK